MNNTSPEFDWENSIFNTSDEAYDEQILECMQEPQYKQNLKYSRESLNNQDFANNIVKFNKFPDSISD
jgi:hypothetical protein